MPEHTAFMSSAFAANLARALNRACIALKRASIFTGRMLKLGFLATLEAIERALLNPVSRERIHATTTFALIFAFAVTSVDFLITGGFELGAPARGQHAVYASLIAPTPAAAAAPAAPAELSPELAQATERQVLELSQNFVTPRADGAAAIEAAPSADPAPDAPLAGESRPAKTEPESSAGAAAASKKNNDQPA